MAAHDPGGRWSGRGRCPGAAAPRLVEPEELGTAAERSSSEMPRPPSAQVKSASSRGPLQGHCDGAARVGVLHGVVDQVRQQPAQLVAVARHGEGTASRSDTDAHPLLGGLQPTRPRATSVEQGAEIDRLLPARGSSALPTLLSSNSSSTTVVNRSALRSSRGEGLRRRPSAGPGATGASRRGRGSRRAGSSARGRPWR